MTKDEYMSDASILENLMSRLDYNEKTDKSTLPGVITTREITALRHGVETFYQCAVEQVTTECEESPPSALKIEESICDMVERGSTPEDIRRAVINGVLSTLKYTDACQYLDDVFKPYK